MARARGEIVGRDEELETLDEFLGATADLPGVLLIEGEPGIGKTTLWRHAVASAGERYLVLSCTGSERDATAVRGRRGSARRGSA